MKLKRMLAFVLSLVIAIPMSKTVSLTADDMVAPIFFEESSQQEENTQQETAYEAPAEEVYSDVSLESYSDAQDTANNEQNIQPEISTEAVNEIMGIESAILNSNETSTPSDDTMLYGNTAEETASYSSSTGETSANSSAAVNSITEITNTPALADSDNSSAKKETVVLNGNQNDGVTATDGNNYIVNGDVYLAIEKGAAVNCTGGSSVTVNGNVDRDSASSMAVYVNKGYVHVTGDVDATSTDPEYVNPSGKKYADGLETDCANSTIVVDGNVTAPDIAIDCSSANTVIVGGNVTSTEGNGVVATNGSTIDIGGVVSAAGKEFVIKVEQGYDNKGVIKAAGVDSGSGSSLHFKIYDDECLKNLDKYMPDIVIGEIENVDSRSVSIETYDANNNLYTTSTGKKVEEIYGMIQYVISVEYDQSLGTHQILGDNINRKYDSATENSEVTISIVPNDGCILKEVTTENAKLGLTRIGDGLYTLTVPRGGGVKINAILEKIVQDEAETPSSPSDNSSQSGDESTPSSSTSEAASQTGANEHVNTNQKNDSEDDKKSDNNIQNSNVQYNSFAIDYSDMMAAFNRVTTKVGTFATAGNNYVLCLYDNTVFDATDLASLSKICGGKKILVYYWWNNIEYCVEIPEGYPLYTLLGVDGKVSRLNLTSALGSKRTGRTR